MYRFWLGFTTSIRGFRGFAWALNPRLKDASAVQADLQVEHVDDLKPLLITVERAEYLGDLQGNGWQVSMLADQGVFQGVAQCVACVDVPHKGFGHACQPSDCGCAVHADDINNFSCACQVFAVGVNQHLGHLSLVIDDRYGVSRDAWSLRS